MTILKEFIEFVLAEKYKKPWQSGVKKFNYDDFVKSEDKELYLDLVFKNSGKGSSRTVYIINTKKCLKLAYNEKGKAQNRAEWQIFSTTSNTEMYAKIYKYGEDFGWLESELVRPFSNENEFEQVSGVWFTVYKDILEQVIKKNAIQSIEEFDKYARARIESMKEQDVSPRIMQRAVNSFKSMKTTGLINLALSAKENDLKTGDLIEAEHYGKAADGRVVILDYGFTTDVWNNYYKDEQGTYEDRSTKAKDKEETDSEVGTMYKYGNFGDEEVVMKSRIPTDLASTKPVIRAPKDAKTATAPLATTAKAGKPSNNDGTKTKR